MSDFIIFNLNRLIETIHIKYNIPKNKLNKLLNCIIIPKYPSFTSIFKIYNDKDNNKFIILHQHKDYYYALKFD